MARRRPGPPEEGCVDRWKRRHGRSDDQRTAAQRDRDRILYCSAFRRLAGVTQVVSPAEGHVFHNRLTHSLKVAQIGRRLAEDILDKHPDAREMLDPDVVEAAALAHDLGHPPFGHVAETTLNRLVAQVTKGEGFEGNPQSFRIVTALAAHRSTYLGLNLTRATLSAIVKYPWYYGEGERPDKWGAYKTDADDFEHARAGLTAQKTLEAQVMDCADGIAYSVHDLEDFLRAGLIPIHRLRQSYKLRIFVKNWLKEREGKTEARLADLPVFSALVGMLYQDDEYSGTFSHRAAIRSTTSALISRYFRAANFNRVTKQLEVDRVFRVELAFLQRLVWYYVIANPRLATLQAGQERIIRALFGFYLNAIRANQAERLPARFGQQLELARLTGSDEARARLAADIVASLADQEALQMYRRICGSDPGSVTRLLPA